MLKKLTKTAAALGLAATLTACGVTGGPLIREGEPVGMITIRNTSQASLQACGDRSTRSNLGS